MVLSAPPEKWNDIFITESTTENVERIRTAIEYFRAYLEWREALPYLILNGEANQLPMMLSTAVNHYFPADRILLVDCGRRPNGNTKTQFTTLKCDARFAGGSKCIVVVTSWYHIPRVARAIAANNRKNLCWNLLALPEEESRLQILPNIIDEEVQRILEGVTNGLLAAEPIPYLAE
jgi:hypothetical protein